MDHLKIELEWKLWACLTEAKLFIAFILSDATFYMAIYTDGVMVDDSIS